MRNVNEPRSGPQNMEKTLLELLRCVIQELFAVGRIAAGIIYFPKRHKDDRTIEVEIVQGGVEKARANRAQLPRIEKVKTNAGRAPFLNISARGDTRGESEALDAERPTWQRDHTRGASGGRAHTE